jgi:ubiquitin-like-conjugating enzyme ATG10
MEASVRDRDLSAEQYLIIWMGALGGCVGLNMPLALATSSHSSRYS